MVETVLAVLFITFVFFGLLQLSQMLTARILMDHASARAARAKAVGFNDFMCLKCARVAMIPVAGERLWPTAGGYDEVGRLPAYLEAQSEPYARGILEYERWNTMPERPWYRSSMGLSPEVKAAVSVGVPNMIGDGERTIHGEAKIESHFPYYMNDSGL